MTKNPNETPKILRKMLIKDEDTNLKYINKKKKRNNSLEIKKKNLSTDTKNKKEENSIINPNKISDTYEIIDIPNKELLIKKCYEYIIQLNDDEKKNLSFLEKILFPERIKFKLIYYTPMIKIFFNGEPIIIEKNPRIITFIDEEIKKKYKRFIYSSSSLLTVFNQLDFQSYYVKIKDKNEINFEEKSNNSTISLDNYCSIFSEENITEIYKFNKNPILSEKNFINRRKDKLNFLKDLSNTSYLYYREKKDNKFIKLEQYDELFDSIKKFIESYNTQTMYLFGPKRASKTTFLLFSKNLFLDVNFYSIYLDYFYLNTYKNEYEQIKKIILFELLYSFSNCEEMYIFEKKKYFILLNLKKTPYHLYIIF